jgi:MFS family permease
MSFAQPERVARLVGLVCVAEVLSIVGVFAFPSIQVELGRLWGLDAVALGWINGLYYAAYGVGVCVLSSLTDRVDARTVFLGGSIVSLVACCGFALLAAGFWSALLLRAAAGLGLAGTFIPALRALLDRLPERSRSRGMAWYTSSFAFGTSISFYYAGAVARSLGWRWVFGGAGVLSLVAALLVWIGLDAVAPPEHESHPSVLRGLLAVLESRPARLNILAYAGHMWELFALRTWIVSLLWYTRAAAGGGGWEPTVVAAIANLVAMVLNILVTEAAHRFTRRSVLVTVMLTCITFGVTLALGLPASYGIVALAVSLYLGLAHSDAALLYAGTVEAAPAGRQGAALAAHSVIGFTAAFAGSLTVGWAIELAGGQERIGAWSAALVVIALGTVGSLVAVARGAGRMGTAAS